MSTQATVRCTGCGPLTALSASDVPRGAAPVFAELARLCEQAQESARHRLDWLDDPAIAAEVSLPTAEELASIVRQAIDAEDAHLAIYRADADGRLIDPTAQRSSGDDDAGTNGVAGPFGPASEGGAILLRASRFSHQIADLCDEVSLAIGGPVGAAIVLGRIPTDSWALADFNVLVRLTPGDAGADRSIGRPEIAGGWGAGTLIVHGHRPTLDDVWDAAERKAPHWPRLRADLPFDLDAEIQAYGIDEPTDPVELLLDQYHQLFSEETFHDALAATRAEVRPVARPRPSAATVPTTTAAWNDLEVVGRFPGGIGRLDAPSEEGNWLVFAGHTLQVADHLVDLVATLLRGVPTKVSDLVAHCPDGDPLCAARVIETLHPLGVVAVTA